MNCDLACHLIDDYLENRLSYSDRQRLEKHLTLCPHCAEELRVRPAFDQEMWRALTTSVQHLRVPPETSRHIVRAAQTSVRHGIWSKRAVFTIQLMAGAAATALLVVGLLLMFGRIHAPEGLPLFGRPSTSRPAISLTRSDMLIEPEDLRPGEPFTTTLFLHSQLSQPVDAIRFRLDIEGPAGDYHFILSVHGPFAAGDVSVLKVTPDLLTVPCREQYQISPADIVRVPGVYTIRATLVSPVIIPEQ